MINFNCRSNFTISAILEKDGITPKESHQHRIGRQGRIFILSKDNAMFFTYLNGKGTLVTSTVNDFKEDDKGITITTSNSVYRLDCIDNQ